MIVNSLAELAGTLLEEGDTVKFDLNGVDGVDQSFTIDGRLEYDVERKYLYRDGGNAWIFFALGLIPSVFLSDIAHLLCVEDGNPRYWPEVDLDLAYGEAVNPYGLLTEIVRRLYAEIERRKNPMILVAEWAKKVDEAVAKKTVAK